jgi:cell filamentation protein
MTLNSFDKELISSNLLGATNLEELHRKEKLLTNTKMLSIQENPIEGNLDYVHLKAIHKFLFSEVYSWAGQDRYDAHITAKFGKDTTLFTPYEKLPSVSKILFDALSDEKYFKGQDKIKFIESASTFMNGLNILHPFREGNGRVQRIYMQYLAKNAGYELNFENISSEEMVQASIEGAQGNLLLLKEIFTKSL